MSNHRNKPNPTPVDLKELKRQHQIHDSKTNHSSSEGFRWTNIFSDSIFAGTMFYLVKEIVYNSKHEIIININILPFIIGFLSIAFAANVGVFRFTGLKLFVPLHEYTSYLASTVGVPLIAYQFLNDHKMIDYKLGNFSGLEEILIIVVGLILLRDLIGCYVPTKVYELICGLLLNVTLIIIGLHYYNLNDLLTSIPLFIGVLTLTFSGIFVDNGSNTSFFGFNRIDLFHFHCIISFFCYWYAFMRYKNLDSHFFQIADEQLKRLLNLVLVYIK